MKQVTIFVAVFFLLQTAVFTQSKPLTYYLPDISYDATIPTPEQFFGYQIGEWHLSHDRQYAYMRALAEASPRITLTEYGRTYEERPLIYLTITSEANHANLEAIRARHVQLSDPDASASLDLADMPAVLYQGFSIHGNEPSGGNAAPLVAYYLAAGQSPEVQRLLDEVVILFDPCYNPDGFQRFSTWANMHKNQNLTADPQDREYDESWPGGRTNHYWFDINRDWLLLQHPESRGRIETFHQWKPNVLTDHHEMGTNSTFFFMPGEPQRTHPVTPWRNQELTAAIGNFHAEALDAIGSLYYSGEGYDDFYYGKGSTYPDANGCIGILFEQASSRGHLQETDNGPLSFPFTIRNQVATALSTHRALVELRGELLSYQRDFYRQALEEAAGEPRRAIVFGEPHDRARLNAFLEVLRRHQVKVHRLTERVEAGGHTFEPESAYIVPMQQPQYRTVRAIFDTMTVFQDSLFYDVSSWTLPHAFNIAFQPLSAARFAARLVGEEVPGLGMPLAGPTPEAGRYAYLFEWDEYYAPRAAHFLLKNELRAKVAMESFVLDGRRYGPGTVMVPVANQEVEEEELYQLMQIAARATGVTIRGVNTGLSPEGIDLGSRDFEALREPKVLLIVGEGVSSYEAGEAWHLLDQRYGLSVTMIETGNVARADLARYNVIVMVNGSYGPITGRGVEALKEWVQAGGVLVATKGAVRWVTEKGLGYVALKKNEEAKPEGRRPYGKLSEDRGADVIGGAIFEAELDLTHPLAFGYRRERLPVFRNHDLFFERAENPYAAPLVYTAQPLLSGYISDRNLQRLSGTPAAVVTGTGSGKVICLADNPNFRAYWYGTNKLFANALFFGHTISNRAREQQPRRDEQAAKAAGE